MLHKDAKQPVCPLVNSCTGAFVNKPAINSTETTQTRTRDQIKDEALDFIDQYYAYLNRPGCEEHIIRKTEVGRAIESTGTYTIRYEELVFGAKTAWRNAPRCSGRIQWKNIQVFDARDIKTATEMFRAVCKHITWATNGGNIRSAMTVFPARTNKKKDFRIWNSQFIRYAGYRMPNGHIVGDPANLLFTQICESLGWKGKGGRFDVLPLVISANGEHPEMFEIPKDIILEVQLTHPRFDWFRQLGLKWYALPVVSNMLFDCGGLEFPAAPFNGWYMGTEIGARNLCDVQRYNQLEIVAQHMGLNCRSTVNLWKDLALVEVNIAVLHSYQKAGVSIVDHHTASEGFLQFMRQEAKSRGGCPADWVWIVPPISGSITPVFHQEMANYTIKPSFEYQEDPSTWYELNDKKKWRNSIFVIFRVVLLVSKLKRKIRLHRPKCLILFASETGKSEHFSSRLEEIMCGTFNTKRVCMEDYYANDLEHEQIVLVVASTFGLGDPPINGESFFRDLKSLEKNLCNVRYAVFGLGSKAYPEFCAFAKRVDQLLEGLGAKRIVSVVKADSLTGQERPFVKWSSQIYNKVCTQFGLHTIKHTTDGSEASGVWNEEKFRISIVKEEPDLLTGLSEIHGHHVTPATLISATNLQHKCSGYRTLQVKLKSAAKKNMLSYRHGDHMAICPANNEAMVTAVMKRIKDDIPANTPVRLEVYCDRQNEWKKHPSLPQCSIDTALRYYLDISKPPSQDFLWALAQLTTHNKEYERLKDLAKDEDAFLEWREGRNPGLVDVLDEFHSVDLPVSFLFSQLPLLEPRYYSVSSSPSVFPGEVHLTVGVIQYKTKDGKVHRGICSNWLENLLKSNSKQTIPCLIKPHRQFQLPTDHRAPVIMMGVGAAIAPFRGFWQHRNYEMTIGGSGMTFGTMSLYFGCRQKGMDDLYCDEIALMKQRGVLTDVHNAYSRTPGQPKIYIQHLLYADAHAVYRQLMLEGGHLFVCGGTTMAKDIRHTLQQIICEAGHTTSHEALRCVEQLRKSGHYHEDLFGLSYSQSSST